MPVSLPGESLWTEETGGLQPCRVRQNWATTHTTVCIYGIIAYIFSQRYLFLIGIFALNVNIDVFGLKHILSFALYLTNSVLLLSFLVLFWSVVISISSLYWLDNVLTFYCLVPSPQFIRSYIFFISFLLPLKLYISYNLHIKVSRCPPPSHGFREEDFSLSTPTVLLSTIYLLFPDKLL